MNYKEIVKEIDTKIKDKNNKNLGKEIIKKYCHNSFDIINIIHDFIGKGGLLPFEHGFKRPLIQGHIIYSVSDLYANYVGGKILLSQLDMTETEILFIAIIDYYYYCKHIA